MGVRLEPSDEYMHELGPEPNFNESMYVNIFDPDNKIGGFFRIGNRANEGYAEMTICLYLPDGQVGFLFKRAEISNNDAFDAGGMRWTMITPFEELRVAYEGKVVLLDDPLEMADPKKAFTENPYAEASIDITFTGHGRASMFGGEPDEPHETPGEEFAAGTTNSSSPARDASASANASGWSSGSACVTTHGGRASGRRRGTTAG